LAGTVMVQLPELAASAAVWLRLMAAPCPSTGWVAMSPSCCVAIGPFAKSFGVTFTRGPAGADGVAAAATSAPAAPPDGHGDGDAAVVGAPIASATAAPDAGAVPLETQEPSAA
jgi:hypothetical protein